MKCRRLFKSKTGGAKAKKKTAPFTSDLTPEEVEAIMDRSMKLTDRYRGMKKAGASEAEIRKAFNTKQEMTVFTYQGDKDTIMTPMDSIRYYKHFLRAGFMSMDPVTGYVKAYVGGPNFNNFQYDMAMKGRRQVGSTIKPYLYTLAMENGFSPCDETRHVEQTLIDENGKIYNIKGFEMIRISTENFPDWYSKLCFVSLDGDPYSIGDYLARLPQTKNIDLQTP